jgi:aminomethyltransferase
MLRRTPFHERTFPLSQRLDYREWAGCYAAGAYDARHEHEYHAIRHAAALIDVSPLYKYVVTGPDAARLVDRVIPRPVSSLRPGRVIYTPWCDERGFVIDDGTVSRLAEDRFRWTSSEPSLRWLVQQSAGLEVSIEDRTERIAALAVQGPTSAALLAEAADVDLSGLVYFSVTSGRLAGRAVDVSRTGYTGDLGFEIWMDADGALPVWDAIASAGPRHGLTPAGLKALDVARIEAGLLLAGVDFTGAPRALTADQRYSPFEMGLGRLVDLAKPAFIGRAALAREAAGRPTRRIVGLTLDWVAIERLYERAGLPPAVSPVASRVAVPVHAGHRQVGRMTSSTWSPVLKKYVGLATLDASFSAPGSRVEVEHTVEGMHHRVPASVAPTPFFRPARKTQRLATSTSAARSGFPRDPRDGR